MVPVECRSELIQYCPLTYIYISFNAAVHMGPTYIYVCIYIIIYFWVPDLRQQWSIAEWREIPIIANADLADAFCAVTKLFLLQSCSAQTSSAHCYDANCLCSALPLSSEHLFGLTTQEGVKPTQPNYLGPCAVNLSLTQHLPQRKKPTSSGPWCQPSREIPCQPQGSGGITG